MKTRFLTIATLLLNVAVPTFVSAQQAATLLTEQASGIASVSVGSEVDKASLRSLLSKFNTLNASFNQTITDMHGQELQTSTGALLLKKPQQLKWTVTSPEESLLIADGTTVYNVDPFVEQVTLLDQSSLTKSNPLMLLITDQESQWQQVAVVKIKKSYQIISLVADSPITKLMLNFGQNDKLLSIESVDRQQQKNNLVFNNVEYDSGTSVNDFTFTPEPNWIVDDQRETPRSE